MDPVEQGLLGRLRARPSDEDTRLVYADWLEEQGRARESEFLRVQCSLRRMSTGGVRFERASGRLRELARELDPHWRMLVAHAPIERCEVRFDFTCPKQWAELDPTDRGDAVRFCRSCQKDVHYAADVAEAYAHAREGRCVVVDLVQIRRPGDLETDPDLRRPPMMMGAVAPPPEWNPPATTPPAKPSLYERVRAFLRS